LIRETTMKKPVVAGAAAGAGDSDAAHAAGPREVSNKAKSRMEEAKQRAAAKRGA